MRYRAAWLLLVWMSGCAESTQGLRVTSKNEGLPPRETVIAYAHRYVELQWVARPQHIFHGFDHAGVRIDTADNGYVHDGWKIGNNIGVPYSWGGFDTPEDFLRKLNDGWLAGNVPRGRDARASSYSTGIDCSGLVSRSWGLPRPYSTRELPAISVKLETFSALEPGDILNKSNGHVLLFEGFGDSTRSRVKVIEAGAWDGGPSKVVESEYSLEQLQHDGFVPLRDRRRLP